jgi:gas vesicle protein
MLRFMSADMQTDFDRLVATLVSRPDDEIRDSLTRFWADNLDAVNDDVADWIEDDTASLANGERVTRDISQMP